ncbi:NADH dehydrogenase [ubiquinone] 1 alpha subcomplex subunit 11 [Toxorhynchites rutilus septentrionalis]|uniref:NADH dehydrogenase [ubiquinone] 1 alpha subcomplex subunit 11 n=1 Tax=Toxorhynchites rutilus septentrionalis TaxID=329112 RepID=UPI0024786FD6|nr:NADH dehydrogenase [ubiquinone] 1 alpha subcomplex subunit 11 [Toxorhynchites rutilus septentrionalis]XP_055621429.1 NADH dehydrogenase [ubiquinone] 1 alpha subcomplex subunit 11 [Toxorhynchites rutilus septentrionalis]
MNFLKSHYYDSPEGTDLVGKMFTTNKYALMTGVAYSSVEVLMVSKPKGVVPSLARYVYFTGPFMGMASAFTVGTYAATKLRGKDDAWNYVVGGFAAGGIYGAWKRSVVSGLVSGLFFSIAAAVKKDSIDEGWEFFPEVKQHAHGTLNPKWNDFTITQERERGWTTGK